MKVILTQDIKKLGKAGELKEVSDGYARNYLIPKGLAEEATSMKLKEVEEKNLSKSRKKAKEKAAALETKEKLDGNSVTIKVKTGGGDKLFGAVTTGEIADILQKEYGVSIDKKKIDIKESIKHLGDYKVKIKLYPEVQAEIQVTVISK
ncbi:LSU ribosomal protein L9p [Candidatus Syntrophocurvum alkaliphilum]|uniref:Large ribosomal subunit protein bL9 n=1 Tax=Candidatus Syntrophocurvum alkaliphilum TaxID=2293317 RepID=A0A6I6DEZ4_9FIRM|nr:50S ribosomal protein L9 [Candidatus Syntrophocurvum alkaliphilum]QGU00646.1 LSU ribosomal protein L9p [Candidatus Syntrophocurvum alkaliphilum]